VNDPFGPGDLGEMLRRTNGRFDSPEAHEQYFQVLVRMAANDDRRARQAAAFRLGWFLADPDGRAEELIGSLIIDPESMVRFGAAKASLRNGSPSLKEELAPNIVDSLLEAIRSHDGLERAKLISMLGRFPSQAAAMLPTLIEALGSENPRERCNASGSLGDLGIAAAPAIKAICQAIERENEPWNTPEWTMDLRRVHAKNLYKVSGDSAWTREVVSKWFEDAEIVEQIRCLALRFPKTRDRPESTCS
jgi:HEAT repeat protein